MDEDLFVTLPSGCRICYRTFGSPSDPAILLISGHSTSMTQKLDEIVRRLNPADNPHFVIRYDHRDTGLSTSFAKPADGSPAYAYDALVDDPVGLIRHLGLGAVHVVGISLGGSIAWQVATRLPGAVRSLALVITSPVGRQQRPDDGLPPIKPDGQWLLGEAYGPPDDPDDDEGWIRMYGRLDLCLATRPPTQAEREESRRESEVTYRRERQSGTMWTKSNHSDVSGARWPRESLRRVRCPTVVVHAAEDQLFAPAHGEALRDDVPGATLVVLEDCGHEFPHRVRPRLAAAILENAAKAERAG
ncbi:putative hydrolase or acyltransferase of alpha beta superfamily protein [Rosellinia necatrix]|uniref:Putative hydrolase or acyltransferase of alpha beta superfamily protein n=1 Tax=Rosellinia necatrix TaxID=77044 RepID=A0A1W2TQE5_ROSNE|nr:putative hydrolase or acyltransferase of alpha beta superfamily protein [Rosellinia necatrix]